MEVCKLPGQKRVQRMTDQMTADMCAKTCTRPVDRQRRITERAKHNAYDTDPFLAAFRVRCNPQLVQVTGRVLEAPMVQYGTTGRNPQMQPRMGAWNMRDTHLHTPVPLRAWAVVNLGRNRDDQVQRFIESLCNSAYHTGKRGHPLSRFAAGA